MFARIDTVYGIKSIPIKIEQAYRYTRKDKKILLDKWDVIVWDCVVYRGDRPNEFISKMEKHKWNLKKYIIRDIEDRLRSNKLL